MHVSLSALLLSLQVSVGPSVLVSPLRSVCFAMKKHWWMTLRKGVTTGFIPALPHSLTVTYIVYVWLSWNLYPSCETLTLFFPSILCFKTSSACSFTKLLISSWGHWLISHKWLQLHPRHFASVVTVSLPLSLCLLWCTIKLPMSPWVHVLFITHSPLFCYFFPFFMTHYSISLVKLSFQHNNASKHCAKNTPSSMMFRQCCKGLFRVFLHGVRFMLFLVHGFVLFFKGERYASPSFRLLWPALIRVLW